MVLDDVREGTRVRLLSMPNDAFPVPTGTEGEVLGTTRFHDGKTQIAMRWDNGRSLAMIVPEDTFEIIGQPS